MATGPRTEEGKRRSSLNSLRHGMRAESPQALQAIEQEIGVTFDEIHQEMREHFRPADKLEEYLVKRVARCLWRIEHGQAMEHKLLDRRPTITRPGVSYEKVMRYERLVDIHLHRAITALKRKQSERSILNNPFPNV
jgi:hypothetical protein